jgi:hypothetical protein
MTLNPGDVPTSIDYTSKDYYALRNDLITRVSEALTINGQTKWTGNDPADFGVVMLEAFAHVGDVLNYYIDRVANENFLSTASQRQSVINIARMYGYEPTGYLAATLNVTFTSTNSSNVTLPVGTQVSTKLSFNDVVQTVTFTTLADVIVPANSNAVVGVVQGIKASSIVSNNATYGYKATDSASGLPNQSYSLPENQIVDDSLQVYVESPDGSTFYEWQKVEHLTDAGSNDSVYAVEIDANNYLTLVFGDSTSGAIPPQNSKIYVDYLIGGGTIGNINPGVSMSVYVPRVGAPTKITASSTTSGLGGTDPESTDSIRTNAPLVLSTVNRAITTQDYANVALRVSGVAKASAVATNRSSVTLYIAPQANFGSGNLTPGVSSGQADSSWLTLASKVYPFLSDKIQIGTSVTLSPPTYVLVDTNIKYSKYAQYSDADVIAGIQNALISKYDYNYLTFDDVIYPEEVESLLRSVPGVKNVRIDTLCRHGASGRNTLNGTPAEIFVFSSNGTYLTITPVASLSALTLTNGTISPSFNSTKFLYTVAVTSGQTSVSITPTSASATSITVNGTTVSSGSSVSISTPVSVNIPVNIVVIGDDGISQTTYVLNMYRSA